MADDTDIILRVIRGELPASALRDVDIKITIIDTREGPRIFETENPRKLFAMPQPVDVATGFLSYYPNREALFDWAAVVYVAPDFIDYDRVEEFAEGQVLFDALWDASFGVPIQQEAIELMRRPVAG